MPIEGIEILFGDDEPKKGKQQPKPDLAPKDDSDG